MANATDLTNTTTALAVTSDTDDPAVLQRQIDYTRAQLATTINAIGERLSPDNLLAQAKSSAKEATVGRFRDMTHEANRKMEGMSNSLGQTMRENPLPVAVIGLGLGWLLMANRNKRNGYLASDYDYRSGGYRYYEGMDSRGRFDGARDRMGEVAHDVAQSVEDRAYDVRRQVSGAAQNVGESVSDIAQRAGETVSHTAQRVGETLSDTASRVGETFTDTADRVGETAEMAQERASEALMRTRDEAERLRREAMWRGQVAVDRTKDSFWNTMETNPLALGAVLAIAGAAVGASIPATEYENRLLGETRDRLIGEARTRAQDAVERVQTVVDDTRSAAISEIKDAAERENLLGQSGQGQSGQSGSGQSGQFGQSRQSGQTGRSGQNG